MAIEKAVERRSGALLHFLHFKISRLRVLEYGAVIFTIEGSVEPGVISTIKQFCDEVIGPLGDTKIKLVKTRLRLAMRDSGDASIVFPFKIGRPDRRERTALNRWRS
jgi:hypothetical protein